MKKLLCLFGASLLVLTSCSNDDSTPVDPATTILPKTITNIYGGKSLPTQITYDNKKIVSIVHSKGEKNVYTYTGDVITKEVEYDEKGILDSTTEYIYTNGKLSSKISLETGTDYKYKTKYTHNTDGTISYEEFRIAVATGVEQQYGDTGKYTYKDGNLVKKENSYYGSVGSSTYEYDTKNSPFKNVLGYSLLIDEQPSANNVVKRTYISGSSTYISTRTYIYNSNGFPTEVVSVENGQSDGTTQFVY
jgi:hypothetical protein